MRKVLFALLFVLAGMVANAQLLWRVSGGNCFKSSYLFGTIHLESENFIDSVAGLNDAIASVDAIYGEIVKDEMASTKALGKVMRESMAPADSTIDKLLSPADYALVDSVVRDYMKGIIGLDHLKKYKPSTIIMQIEAMQLLKNFPNYKSMLPGLDLGVQARGEKLGKYVGGFETVEEQLSIAYGSSLVEQAKNLVDMCRKDKDFGQNNEALIAAYHSQDLKALEQHLTDPDTGMDAESMEKMCYSRNRKWMDKIVSTMPVQSMLIVVGAGHLVGEDGLINLLRNRGYVVEPVD